MQSFRFHRLFALTLGASSCALASDQLEEIIVTAQFRDSLLMTSVGSISVLDSTVLQERGARHLEDVLSAAPNVSWSAGASRSRFVQVRGVGDLEQYAEPKYYPSVGIMLDDLELGSAASAATTFDIAQVEVLRGPQGTRFGASAHAGMIQLISNAPTDEFEAELSGGVAKYDSYHLGAVISGPLTDTVRARAALQQSTSDGYVNNRHLNNSDSNNFEETTARVRLQWDPSATANYDFSLFSFDSDNGYDAYSLDNNRSTWSDQPGQDEQQTLAFTAKGAWQLNDELVLEAVASHQDSELLYSYDADWISPELCQIYTCSDGHDTAMETFDRERQRSTLELRLLGGNETLAAGGWRYVVGLYGNTASEDLDYAYPSFWYGTYESASSYDTDRYAIYGELEFALSDRLILAGSARLEQFDDDYHDSNGVSHGNDNELYNGELNLQYQINDDSYLYATLAWSEKPGGVNVSASSQYAFMSPEFQGFMQGKLRFDKESLFNREIGIKGRYWDNRLQLRGALFYASRRNAQLESWMWDGTAGLWVGYLDSTADTDSYGLELETSWDVTQALQLFANIGWLHAEVDSITAFDLDQYQFVTRKDRDQSKSPEYQFNLGLRVAFTESLSGALEVEGRDEAYFGYYHDGKLDGYELLNVNLSWAVEQLTLSVWGRNLLDEDYATHGLYFGADPRDEVGAWANETYYQLGAPRTYGLDITYRL